MIFLSLVVAYAIMGLGCGSFVAGAVEAHSHGTMTVWRALQAFTLGFFGWPFFLGYVIMGWFGW